MFDFGVRVICFGGCVIGVGIGVRVVASRTVRITVSGSVCVGAGDAWFVVDVGITHRIVVVVGLAVVVGVDGVNAVAVCVVGDVVGVCCRVVVGLGIGAPYVVVIVVSCVDVVACFDITAVVGGGVDVGVTVSAAGVAVTRPATATTTQ